MSRVPGVGFGITMSTTYHHPFHIARVFNGLDHVTKGRIAWNAVTSRSKNEAANYGYKKMIEHDERYERAQEHLGVAARCGTASSPMPSCSIARKAYSAIRKGASLELRGRILQRARAVARVAVAAARPVIIQAGQSGPGMDLAAHYADMQFSTRRTVASMKEHRAELDGSSPVRAEARDAASFGRSASRSPSLTRMRREGGQYLDSIPPEAGLIELSAKYDSISRWCGATCGSPISPTR